VTSVSKSFAWGRALGLGFLAAAVLLLCSPIWLLAQLGGPVAASWFWALAVTPTLFIALFSVHASSVRYALFCGLLFSVPLLIACFGLPLLDSNVGRLFRAELWWDEGATVLISLSSMVTVQWLRQRQKRPVSASLKDGSA
jgi:hypothetical protein